MIRKFIRPYYPHSAYASDQFDVRVLRMECGPGVYSVYQSLNEQLSCQDDLSCRLDYKRLAAIFKCDVDVIKSVINDYGLFIISEDGTRFTSVEMMKRQALMQKPGRGRPRKNIFMPYFKHYCDESKDAGFVRLFADHRHEGTEVYWMLKELLRGREGCIYPFDCKALSSLTECREELIRSVICDYGLFELVNDGTAFRCPDLDEQMAQMEEEAQNRATKGRNAGGGVQNAVCEIPQICGEAKVDAVSNADAINPGKSESMPVRKASSGKWDLNLVEEFDEIMSDKEWLGEKAKAFEITVAQLIEIASGLRKKWAAKDDKTGHGSRSKARVHFVNYVSYQIEHGKTSPATGTAQLSSHDKYLLTETERLRKNEERREAEKLARELELKNDPPVSSDYNYISKGYFPGCVPFWQFTKKWRAENPAPYPEWIEKCKTPEGLREIMMFVNARRAASKAS